MKKSKIISILAVIAVIITAAFCITSCKEEQPEPVHSVKVIDSAGNPIKGVIVKFVSKTGAEENRKITNDEGIAEYKNSVLGSCYVKIDSKFKKDGGTDKTVDTSVHNNGVASEGLLFESRGDGTCVLVGIGTCTDEMINIPEKSPSGDTVVAIGEKAFSYETVDLGEMNVAELVDFGKKLTAEEHRKKLSAEICQQITLICIPSSVKEIANNAFVASTELTYEVLDGENNPTFDDDGNLRIKKETFGVCTSLKSVWYDCFESELEKMEIGSDNAVLNEAKKHFYRFEFEKDKYDMQIILRNSKASVDLSGAVSKGEYAPVVSEGTFNVPEGEAGRAFYVFSAKRSGNYKISVISSNSETTIGCYGQPMIVNDINIAHSADTSEKYFNWDVHETDGDIVIGVNRADTSAFTLKIERVGDVGFDSGYVSATPVPSTATLTKLKLSKSTVLVDIDITDPNVKVELNEQDGRYYTSDGKPVYIRLEYTNGYVNPYLLEASIGTISGALAGKNTPGGVNFGGIVNDENGNFVAKYSYNGMIETYLERNKEVINQQEKETNYKYCDDTHGVYYLTAELAEAIKLHGENSGWWEAGDPSYLFDTKNIVVENAWLFVCCIAR